MPQGKIALGKLAQALVHGARLLQVDGNFDDCLELAASCAEDYPVALVNSVNPIGIEGQKTAAFEIVDALGDAPDVHCLPVGNAGNITAYWKGYREYATDAGDATQAPGMRGFQAAGAAPLVVGARWPTPETIATAIRIGNPASWAQALAAARPVGRRDRRGHRRQILAAYRLLAAREACSSSRRRRRASPGCCSRPHEGVLVRRRSGSSCTVTGNGLKDPDRALSTAAPSLVDTVCDADVAARRVLRRWT